MQEMADAIEDVGDSADDATNPVGEFVGSNLALGMALEDDLLPLFQELDISMDDIAKAAEGGSDEFQNMQKRFTTVGSAGEALRRNFDELTEAELDVAEALVEARLAGRITEAQFDDMLNVVDETADAFDDHRKAVEADAEAFMKSTDAAKLLNDANLDAEQILSDLTTSGKTYTEQAEEIFDIVTANAAAMESATMEPSWRGSRLRTWRRRPLLSQLRPNRSSSRSPISVTCLARRLRRPRRYRRRLRT